MTIIQNMRDAKELWAAAVPNAAGMPDNTTFFRWARTFTQELLEFAIVRTGGKMARNLAGDVPLVENAAARYCTSILNTMSKQVRSKKWQDPNSLAKEVSAPSQIGGQLGK